MMQTAKSLLVEAREYVEQFYEECISPDYVYHNFEHVREMVEALEQIASHYQLEEKDMEVLRLAGWFHDTGYDRGPDQHELRSAEHVRAFLRKRNYPEADLRVVVDCILATRLPHQPRSLLEEIICDADMSHLGTKAYWDRCSRIRQELNLTRKVLMSEREWVDFELNFLQNHQYYTDVARELFEERKKKHIRQLQKHRQRFYPDEILAEAAPEEEKDKKKKKKKKEEGTELSQVNLGRGVETMYRTTYRTHINLSSIADNKANIMLSINAIVISIVVSNLVTKLETNPYLIVPTAILLGVCLVSLVFAILSTRPKVTKGEFSREDIQNKQANLLFFGNFYNMKLNDFHWGMMEMIKDSDFLYSSMTRDLYYLGIVLAQKYQYLRICYSVFMYGLIISVIAFGLAFLIYAPAG